MQKQNFPKVANVTDIISNNITVAHDRFTFITHNME